ncbi:leucyl-tRNA synthetase [Chloroherpeton thalassium ATCC 35110]|uniref:Leucine--tRNA ligase n=1 Tax=Chloroherpeton thalassium (strain ATCC 35110 / GB-78) TaxID=517418 RepID=SYL_CHLT3|nr:leucine--tRNA ligase [Chloroherpeton thalassium]B3QRU2.1 RecName: Full=Leucine--tRNA ligase; AltName: Full=Leucyl-tRNA synthetase; Short=LeuRS [Chloroherpeton thalassium ATCC 35110]ACF13895.1 leucyl-tRNA synthetase [Chloroherpeton thalassium ATCC 35110]
MKYDFTEIEKKWQAYWEQHQTFKATEEPNKPKYYVLDMFPYPSGSGLHVGHLEGYTASDITARYKRLKGFSVLHPMGWDAFGLPAEQYAIKTGTHPRLTTETNVANFKSTLQRMGFSYDWSREINTTDPGYVKWTQWIFLKLYEKGLAYVDDVPVNWCEELKVVLANEEVDEKVNDGYTVVRRPLRQWMLKITAYAERLLTDLDEVDWPESVKEMQRNWIGKSVGAELDFYLAGTDEKFRIFTTRPDTVFGATYMVLSPEHPLLDKITTDEHKSAVAAYREEAERKSDLERTGLQKEKTGVFTGSYALNPATGKEIPIWTSDFVLMGYGTGAIMSVPAHDERDWEFAKKFGIPIVEVIKSPHSVQEAVFAGKDSVCTNSENAEISINGLAYEEAFEKITDWFEKKGLGQRKVNYKLRDWLFSRQRYWGEPIPIKHYEDGAERAETELPLNLPEVSAYQPSGTGESPLANIAEWLYGEDEHGKFRRETNTMPQWAGSCWYYLRFIDPDNPNEAVSPEKEKYWMNVDLYIGGAEHAVLHLLYARFWHKVLYDVGVVSTKEPFRKLFNQGMILGEDNEKMSKSRGNVITADSVMSGYGADAVRLYEMFLGPLEQVKPWSTNGIEGISRFLGKVWRLVYPNEADGTVQVTDDAPSETVLRRMHKTIKKVGEDTETLKFNTAISEMMIYVNELQKEKCRSRTAIENLLLMLSPFAPHICEELWQALGHEESITFAKFPEYDATLAKDDVVTIAVQVNGKLRGTFDAAAGLSKDDMIAEAMKVESVIKFTEGKEIVKQIAVPNKLVNLVVK